MQPFSRFVLHFHYPTVSNNHEMHVAISISLIIIINKLVGMIHDQVRAFFCFLSICKSILHDFFSLSTDYYRSMMTKRLDVPASPSSGPIPQTSSSPIPTPSSFHQQRLSSSALSPTSSMAQLTTNSPPIVPHQQDPLKNKLSEILNEQRVLQQRKEELERMVRLPSSSIFPFINN